MSFDEEHIDPHGQCAAEIHRLREALEQSVALQSHYAALLNDYDGGKRMGFAGAEAWLARLAEMNQPAIRRCRSCGCTDDDCRQCITKTGEPCHWVGADLCSACLP